MVELLQHLCAQDEIVAFDNAPDMIAWLDANLGDTRLICLDHDLGANRVLNGSLQDPRTGRHVADFLATQKPVCPVIIHSSNVTAAPGMMIVLDDAGWCCSRLSPYNDLEWVRAAWLDEVKKALLR